VASGARPSGKQFRELYVPKGDPAQHGEYFRTRLFTLLEGDDVYGLKSMFLATLFTRKLGVRGQYLEKQIREAPIERLLSFITVIYEALQARAKEYSRYEYDTSRCRAAPGQFVAHIAEILEQERMACEIDQEGGVHPLIDAEFQRNRRATLASLTAPRYANVDHSFQAAFKRLTVQNFDTKAAIHDIFDASESLFKLMVAPRNPNLTGSSVESDPRPVVDRAFASSDDATKQTAGRALSSFAKWADACHPYRHGQQSETIVAPPQELATVLISQGASFIRWLAGIDQWLQANPKAPPA